MNKKMNLKVDFQFQKEKLSFLKNTSFHEAVVTIMCDGENDNGTYFTRESIENALWSIKNIPLVGLFKEEENNFGGHEPTYEVKDGAVDIVFNTTPFGVIHESAKQWFEFVNENGTKKEYLVSECLFWKRQKGYELLKEKGKFSVSMEIEVIDGDYNDDTQLYEIKEFIFTAIAILGDGVQPCFSSANVKLFSKNNEYNEMMKEVKEFNNKIEILEKEGVDMNLKNYAAPTTDELLKAGVQAEQVDMVMDLIEEIAKAQALGIDVTKYFATTPTVDELLEVGLQQEQAEQVLDLIEEVSKAKALGIDIESILNQVQSKQQSVKVDGEVSEDKEEEQVVKEESEEKVSEEEELDNKESDDAASEEEEKQFAEEDEKSSEQPMEEVDPTEPNPEQDIKSLLEKAVSATTSDEILDIFDQMVTVAGLGEVDIRSLFAKDVETENGLKEQLLSVTTEFEKMKSEYERLVAFEQSILLEQKKSEIETLFAKFSVLDGFDGYDELKDKAIEMPIDEIEQQLFALLGKKSFSLNTPQEESKTPMSIVFEKKQSKEVHGIGVLDKFLIKK